MTTPTPDPLVEQIARAIATRVHVEGEKAWPGYKGYARAALPIVKAAQADAWEKGWEAAIDQAPGDVFFDEWHYQTNPYGTDQEATR